MWPEGPMWAGGLSTPARRTSQSLQKPNEEGCQVDLESFGASSSLSSWTNVQAPQTRYRSIVRPAGFLAKL